MKILVVDNEVPARKPLAERLSKEGYGVVEAENGETASAVLEQEVPDLVLLDIRLPDTDGLTVLRSIQQRIPDLPVIIITAASSVDEAVEAMKLGAFDFVAKPFNLDELSITVQRALENARLRRTVDVHAREHRSRYGLQNIVGRSDAMREVKALVAKVADSPVPTVLLRGPSGTGKDLIARALHAESERSDKPFVNITCTALQDTLLESELFGHEEGSFTDAKSMKRGLFEMGDGGTVLLDEVGDMSPGLQSKLLRVLEERAFRRVGGTHDIQVDVRVIAATNRDLEEMIEAGTFREDLYYRMNAITIDIPPLRDRLEDVALLARHFMRHFESEFKKEVAGISEPALGKLEGYGWPGNVRELRNVIERAVLLGPQPAITVDDIVLGRPSPSSDRPLSLPPDGVDLDELEEDLVRQALERTDGNQTEAGELLGLTRDQIHYRKKKYDL